MAVYWFVRVGVCFFFMFCVQDRPTILHPPFDCCTLNMNTLLKTTYTHGSNNRIPNKLSTNKTFTIYIIWECMNSNSPAELDTFTDHVPRMYDITIQSPAKTGGKKTTRIIDKEKKITYTFRFIRIFTDFTLSFVGRYHVRCRYVCFSAMIHTFFCFARIHPNYKHTLCWIFNRSYFSTFSGRPADLFFPICCSCCWLFMCVSVGGGGGGNVAEVLLVTLIPMHSVWAPFKSYIFIYSNIGALLCKYSTQQNRAWGRKRK